MLVALMLVSVAFAQAGNQGNSGAGVDDTASATADAGVEDAASGDEDAASTAGNGNGRMGAVAALGAQAQERVNAWAKLNVRKRLEAHKENIKGLELRERIQQINEERKALHARLQDRKANLEEKCAENEYAFECKEERRGAKRDAIHYLYAAADRVTAQLNNAKERVAASNLAPDVKAELAASIDAKLAEVEDIQGTVETMSDSSDGDKVKELAGELRSLTVEAKQEIGQAHATLATERIGTIAERAAGVASKLEARIDVLRQAGIDVTELTSDLEAYNAKVSAAKEQAAAGDATAKETIKEAHTMLKELVNAIRAAFEQ